jgi:hypothetical protein
MVSDLFKIPLLLRKKGASTIFILLCFEVIEITPKQQKL